MSKIKFILTTVVVAAMVVSFANHAIAYGAVVRGGAKLIDEAIEAAMKLSGRSVSPAARQALTRQMQQAVIRHGDEALALARSGGLELMEAAGRYGDEVWQYARQVPEGARALGLRADELVPAVRRFGVDVLRLEAKTPGLTTQVARMYGDDAVRYFGRKVPAGDATRLVGFGRKADSPATRKALLDAYKKNGSAFLDKLDWKRIMATGLSISMVTAAYQVSDGVQEGLKRVAEDSPETFHEMIKEFVRPVTAPVFVLGIGIAVILLVRFYLNNRWLTRRRKDSNKKDNERASKSSARKRQR